MKYDITVNSHIVVGAFIYSEKNAKNILPHAGDFYRSADVNLIYGYRLSSNSRYTTCTTIKIVTVIM